MEADRSACRSPAAFERHGEEGFREREAEVVGSLLESADGGAIALGGGSSSRRGSARRSTATPSSGCRSTPPRPGAGSPTASARWRPAPRTSSALLAERLPLYEELADAVVPDRRPRRSSRGPCPRSLALADLPAGTKLLWAASASGEYPIFVGRGLLQGIEAPPGGRCSGERFCVTDSSVGPLYAGTWSHSATTVEVPPGEEAKTMAEAEQVLRRLAEAGMTREDHVIALGGGVVGDLGGFCAHLYQRGVPVVQVPTTLVAQVDSAYGGKTGVDLPEGKNYAGAYHLPAAVIADTATLATLPRPSSPRASSRR